MNNGITWVGMDVHAHGIAVAVYRGWEKEAEEWEFGGDDRGIGRLRARLAKESGEVRCVYEAGPCGYELARELASKGIGCEVAAPSLIPRRAGERIKTDRRDARKLGSLYRSGELTLVTIPDSDQEALRDLLRAREDIAEDVLRRRHRLSRFLLRHGYRYRQGQAWTQKHWNWMQGLKLPSNRLQDVMGEYQQSVREGIEQLKRLDRLIEEASQEAQYQPLVEKLMVLRGVARLTGLTVVAEAGDLKRYPNAPAFMASTGLVPSEYSSGGKRRQGAITKTGNSHLRRVLVEAAWHYRHRPGQGRALVKRRAGQPTAAVALAKRAETRLYRKYIKLISRGKSSQLAAVAVARELAGFIWALATEQ